MLAEGAEDVSQGWRCEPGGPDGGCRDVRIPAGARSVSVRMTREVVVTPVENGPAVALSLGHFAVPVRVTVNGGAPRRHEPGLVLVENGLVPGPNHVAVDLQVTAYRRAPAWDGVARLGPVGTRRTGLLVGTRPGGRAFTLVAPVTRAWERSPLVVALHPWGSGVFAYVGSRLHQEAARRGFFVLTPDGLGNSLYNATAEAEVLAAVDHVLATQRVDPERVSLFGASMGGAGATTVGYRHPDRFAAVVSFFGDCGYEASGMTRAALPTPEARRAASPCALAASARHLPTMLVHGMRDRVSSPRQTTDLDRRLGRLGYPHAMVLRADSAHEQALVDLDTPRALDFALGCRRVARPTRVTFESPDGQARRAYWLEVVPGDAGPWASVDVEADPAAAALRVRSADNVRRLIVHLTDSPFDPSRPPAASSGETTPLPQLEIR